MQDGGWRMTNRPRLRDMLILAALLPVWWLVESASGFEKGFLAWCLAGAFYVVVSELWPFRRRARFWAAIGLFALAYAVGLWAVRVPESLGKGAIDLSIAGGAIVFVAVRRLMRGVPPDA
ncbi:MAG TPA: hypothetical protein VGD56_03575 [Gemmatirosa sp.]